MRRLIAFRHWAVWVFGIALGLAIVWFRPSAMRIESEDWSLVSEQVPRPGDQLVVAVVLSRSCVHSSRSDVVAAIPPMLDRLAMVARYLGMDFVSIGIAVDPDPRSGIDFLREVYRFGEYSSGSGWAGMGALRYLWQDLPGRPATPQVVITRRTMRRETDQATGAVGGLFVGIEDEQELARVIGATSIIDFSPTDVQSVLERLSEAIGLQPTPGQVP